MDIKELDDKYSIIKPLIKVIIKINNPKSLNPYQILRLIIFIKIKIIIFYFKSQNNTNNIKQNKT